MSAVKKEYLNQQYQILYFDGNKIEELLVNAESRNEAIAELKQKGFTPSDIFSIIP